MNDAKPRPQFQLRTLLALMLFVALLVGWWLDHRRQQEKMLQSELQTLELQQRVERSQSEIIELRNQSERLASMIAKQAADSAIQQRLAQRNSEEMLRRIAKWERHLEFQRRVEATRLELPRR